MLLVTAKVMAESKIALFLTNGLRIDGCVAFLFCGLLNSITLQYEYHTANNHNTWIAESPYDALTTTRLHIIFGVRNSHTSF
jgi:hypothetical protein